MIATAESCTAGLSAWLTSLSGSSKYYKEGAIVYSNEAKANTVMFITTHRKKGAVCKRSFTKLCRGYITSISKYVGNGITEYVLLVVV